MRQLDFEKGYQFSDWIEMELYFRELDELETSRPDLLTDLGFTVVKHTNYQSLIGVEL